MTQLETAATVVRGLGGTLAAWWGVLGITALLGQAAVRLGLRALEPIRDGSLTATQTSIFVAWVVFNLYVEGYRAFQKLWSPRVAARALHLAQDPRPVRAILAPIFCMQLFAASRKRLITAWVMVVAIVLLVVAVSRLSQPWRGIVDGGVVVALVYGAVCVLVFFVRGLAGKPPPAVPDVPS